MRTYEIIYQDLYSNFDKYINDTNYVYTSCYSSSGEYIVILRLLFDSKTDMNRKDIIDSYNAQYKADKLEVVMICNKLNLNEMINEIIDELYKPRLRYKVGDVIHNSNGIYFYKSIMRAYLFELNYDYCYYDRILKYKLDGEFKIYQDNGLISRIVNYSNGKLQGEYIDYDDKGNMIIKCNYLSNGLLDGIYLRYYPNGQIEIKCNYLNGELKGRYIECDMFGNIVRCEKNEFIYY